MIRFRLKERIADWEFKEGRNLTLAEIAKETKIHRTTLSKIANIRSYNTTTDNIDKLCQFFNCDVKDLMEVILDQDSES
ncbi:MAG: helix-turn-helix transcriptional regulator [Ghiorsea sp.]|nr:helix-turn-helix transcriptional regulator [Ghiorsea sp.]